MEKHEQLYSIFQKYSQDILVGKKAYRQVISPDLVATLTMHTMIVFLIHLGFKIKENKDHSIFLNDVKKALNGLGQKTNEPFDEKKDTIIQAIADTFKKHNFPESESQKAATDLFRDLELFFRARE